MYISRFRIFELKNEFFLMHFFSHMIVHVRWTYSMRASQCEICFDVTMQNVLHHNVNTFQEQTNFRESLKKHSLTQQNLFFIIFKS
jgi:hypothetical protein